MAKKSISMIRKNTNYKEADKTICWWEYIGAVLLGLSIMYFFLYRTGTCFSGYHFLDDHELVRAEYAFREQGVSLWSMLRSAVLGDLGWRYRPFYWVERTVGEYLWGSNLYAWNLYTAGKGVLCAFLLYLTARNFYVNRICSILFTAIIMVGQQFVPWYRSANQESLGLLLLSAALFLIAVQHHQKREKSLVYDIGIAVFSILAALTKESFLLVLPAVMGLKFWLAFWEKETTMTVGKRIGTCLKQGLICYIPALLVFLISCYLLLFVVGVDKVSYAGFDESVSLSTYFYGIRDTLSYYLKWYTVFGGAAVFLVLMCYQLAERDKIWKLAGLCLLALYVMGIELVAHAKSLMTGRYIIPYIVGYACLIVLLGYHYFKKDSFRRRVYTAGLCLLLLLQVPAAYSGARDYAYEGKMTAIYFQAIMDRVPQDGVIIAAIEDEELDLSTASWLEVHGWTQVFYYDRNTEELTDQVQLVKVQEEMPSWEAADLAICYGDMVQTVVEKMGLNGEDSYGTEEYQGCYLVYRK